MRKYLALPVLLLLAACSSPLLKWIEAPPDDENSAFAETYSGIKDQENLLEANYDSATKKVTATVNPAAATGTGAPYSAPYSWYLDGKKYDAPDTGTTLVVQTQDLAKGRHELVLIATGSDGLHYTANYRFLID